MLYIWDNDSLNIQKRETVKQLLVEKELRLDPDSYLNYTNKLGTSSLLLAS